MGDFKFDSPYDQERQPRPVRINPKWDRLTKKSVAATNFGTTYGKYAAKLEEEERKRGRRERE